MEDNFSKKNNKTISSIVKVTLSNIIKLGAGILVGFLLPKIIGIDDYGYYKTFTLYATYVGLFQIGIEDGIYLKYGGKNYEDLDKNLFCYYSKFLLIMQLVIAITFICGGLLITQSETKFIFVCLGVYLFAYNITGYYQFISQITSRFNELSFRNIVQSIFTSMSILVLFLISHFNGNIFTYKEYTIIFVLIQFVLAIWYMYTYRDITFHVSKIDNSRKEIFQLIKIGFPLMIANLCLLLILNIDRQFVNILFDNQTYAVYAFAYNMLTLISTATTAIATVLYPTLKKTSIENLNNKFYGINSVVLSFVFLCLLVYYPLAMFVSWFLPKYENSLIIFRIILPGLAISSSISIVFHNYYKVIGKNNIFFLISLIILLFSFVANLIGYIIFKNTISISIASVIVLFFWYILSELYFIIKYKVKWIKNFIYLVISIIAFYFITIINNPFIGFGIHVLIYIIITSLFYLKDIYNYKKGM